MSAGARWYAKTCSLFIIFESFIGWSGSTILLKLEAPVLRVKLYHATDSFRILNKEMNYWRGERTTEKALFLCELRKVKTIKSYFHSSHCEKENTPFQLHQKHFHVIFLLNCKWKWIYENFSLNKQPLMSLLCLEIIFQLLSRVEVHILSRPV